MVSIFTPADTKSKPACHLQITEGSGRMLVTAVGVDSEWGKTMALVAGEVAETPLQLSLGTLAAAIGKVGLGVGGLCFVVLMVRYTTPHSTALQLLSLSKSYASERSSA